MTDNYHISLEEVSLEEYQRILESKEILPGRRILKEDILERFEIIRNIGVKNLKELLDQLKTKKNGKFQVQNRTARGLFIDTKKGNKKLFTKSC